MASIGNKTPCVAPMETGKCVAPMNPAEDQNPNCELFLADSIAQEVNKLFGTVCDYYPLDKANSQIDPLYREPVKRKWLGPFRIKAYVEKPEGVPLASDEGFSERWEGSCTIARKELEDYGIRSPEEGDVIRFWDVPYWNDSGVLGDNIPRRGFFFDVVDSEEDGNLTDGPEFVQFVLKVIRRTEFTPERRLDPP